MKFHLGTLLVLSTLGSLSLACTPGCLVCDSAKNSCKICDFFNSYTARGNGCISSPILNCETLSIDASCFRCKPNFYYNSENRTCPPVSSLITNCRYYSGPTSCSACIPAFYLNVGRCALASTINECIIFESLSICAECSLSYILNESRTACLSTNLRNNCAKYQNYSCNTCNANSVINKNSYLIKAFELDPLEGTISAVSNFLTGRTDNLVNSVCMPKTVTNCQTLMANNKCFTCEKGYYLNADFTCTSFILKSLSGCKYFSGKNVCSECFDGFYLEGDSCKLTTGVNNCKVYHKTSDGCSICVSTHYQSNGQCQLRQSIIDNCDKYDPVNEKCTKCASSHQLTASGLICVELRNFCAEYSSINANGTVTTCGKCADGYFMNNNVCETGTVSNCKRYEFSPDYCRKCIGNYAVKSDGTCQLIETSVSNCIEYAPNMPVRCQTCDASSYAIKLLNLCISNSLIPNCNKYDDAATCQTCKLGYQLLNKACSEIPENENCSLKNFTGCTKCKDKYDLVNGVCVKVPGVYTDNCEASDTFNNNGQTYLCATCTTGFFPFFGIKDVCEEEASQTFTKIDNCRKYNKKCEDVVTCVLCQPNFALSADKLRCLDSCSSEEIMYYGFFNDDGTSISIDAFAQCLAFDNFTDLPEGCDIASHDLKSNGNVCLKCKDGYVPIEPSKTNNTFFNMDIISDIKLGQAFSTLSCVLQPDTVTFNPTSSSPKAECKLYRQESDTFYCSECVFGLTGTVLEDGSGEPYIDCDAEVEGCDNDAVLNTGLTDDSWLSSTYGFSLTYNFTCHVCTDSSQIPFIHLSNLKALKPYQLNGTDDIPSSATTKDGKMTVCRTPTAAGLNVDESDFTAFVSNCALGLIVVDITKNVTTGASSVRCLGCKDGYKKVLDASSLYIESCEEIANCSPDPSSGWIEGCKTCDSTHVKQINSSNQIDPHDCSTSVTASAASNCTLYSSAANRCAICERGYFLDSRGECILLEIPYCSGYVHANFYPYYKTIYPVPDSDAAVLNNFSYALYSGVTTFDCYKCDTGFLAINQSNSRPLCAGYPNIATDNKSYLSTGCSKYGVDSSYEILCKECGSDFIFSENKTKCYNAADLPFCDVANNSGTQCYTCKPGYMRSNEGCILKPDPNYNSETAYESDSVCYGCTNGTYLDNFICVTGATPHCNNYRSATECISCMNDYYLVKGICLPMPSEIMCKSADVYFGVSSLFECKVCNDGHFLATDYLMSDNTICLDGYIDNCTSYDNTFTCTACASGFYLSEDICKAFTFVDKCSAYSLTQDVCISCDSRYYLSNNTCILISDSVSRCNEYKLDDSCASCGKDTYLSGGVCIAVTPLIENCWFYRLGNECSACAAGYLLVSNACVLITAADCLTYSAPNTCSSCPPSYVFKATGSQQNFKRECVIANIDHCLEINSITGTCRACQTGFIPSLKTCIPANPAIQNCKIQSSNTVCSLCNQGYIRSVNRGACKLVGEIYNLETDCADLRYTTSPTCSACKPGYFFNSNTCVMCSNAIPNCLYCNPVDNTKCYMCSNNYYMTTAGLCVANSSSIEGAEFDDEDEAASIYSAFGFFVTLLLLMTM